MDAAFQADGAVIGFAAARWNDCSGRRTSVLGAGRPRSARDAVQPGRAVHRRQRYGTQPADLRVPQHGVVGGQEADPILDRERRFVQNVTTISRGGKVLAVSDVGLLVDVTDIGVSVDLHDDV